MRSQAEAEAMSYAATHGNDGILQRLLARIEQWGRGNELANLSPSEMQLLAHDVGLDASDLVRLATGESDASRLLYARLQSLGLTMEDIEAKGVGSARDMERTCGLCADRALCEHDLMERPDSEDWRRTCPNIWTFDEIERLNSSKS
jgi:hypothetical protein